MTAVLLTILKIIGIVLLVILGIMLFLLAVLLFVPVRYSVKGTVDNNITAEGKISWLCSIFRYDFTFQEQELNGEVRIFGFRKIHTELTFALADPALTGQVLGILCMMPFLYQYDFHIFPDFESESYYIRGSYDMKGRIQLIFLLITFIRIVADKDLRCFLKKILDKR